jgi:cardiolipin synthase
MKPSVIRRFASTSAVRAVLAFALTLLAGCSTMLPTINPDMAYNRPVVLEGARGPLSAQESKAILERLKTKGKETSIFDRHLALEEAISDSPLVVGNKVTLLQDGPATYQKLFQAISNAKDHVHMETYIFEDDEVGKRFADALIAKAREGVQAALMYDSVGSIHTPKDFFKRLVDNGVKVVEFNPINPLAAKAGWQVDQRDHRKLTVVDGQIAFVGGINISGVYSTGSFSHGSKPLSNGMETPWRDTHLQIEGPVVAEFQKLFLDHWTKQKGAPLADRNFFPQLTRKGNEVVRAIGSSPAENYSLMYATLISAIGSAETNVYLTNAYFVPDQQLLDALRDASQRGVDVRLVLPSQTDMPLVLDAGRSYYTDLLRAGVKIYERKNALLHAKTVVIDGVWSTIGSTNLDWRSFLHNDEVNAVILSADFGAQMRRMFDNDVLASTPITLDKWQERSLAERMKELTARMWKYVL